MRVTFDSNILVYAYDEGDPRRPFASGLLGRAVGRDCVLTVQSLAEFFCVSTRKGKAPADAVLAEIARMRAAFEIVASDADCVEEAAVTANRHKLQFWDAMMLATARKAGCQLLLSEDGHDGLRLNGVTFINPFREKNRVLLDAALPPVE